MAGSLLEKLKGEFLVHDVEEDTTSYYGFMNKDGAWYIIRNVGDTTFRYATSGSTSGMSYTQAWTDRASLDYYYIDQVTI
jgi:hypothetical protein